MDGGWASRWGAASLACAVCVGGVLVMSARPAAAASTTRYVATAANGGSDTNPCTQPAPCATIEHAISIGGYADTIQVGPGLFPTHLDIEGTADGRGNDLTIVGAGFAQTTLDGVDSTYEVKRTSLTMSDLTIQHAAFSIDYLNGSPGFLSLTRTRVINGGPFLASAELSIVDSTLDGDYGVGGICCDDFVRISRSLVVNGGGIDGSHVRVDNSTIADNSHGFSMNDYSSVFASTIVDNNGYGVDAGGSLSTAGIGDSIVAGNTGGNCIRPNLQDGGGNLEDDADASCGFSAASGDLLGVDPQLGPLADNGGPTLTMLPAPGSPVIDAIPTPCGTVDQRGVVRPQGSGCDIGAVEVEQTGPVVTANPLSQTVTAGDAVTFSASASGVPLPSVQWQVSTDGVTFTDMVGATSPTLTFTTSSAQNANQYRAVFTNPAGTAMSTAATLRVCPCSVWPAGVPAVAAASDASAVEVGVKFRSDADGFITGIRFYKGPGNTGVHVGNLWSATGTLLETATFSAETDSGWQTVTFAVPVHITAGTTYVASYHTNVGHYAYTYNGLTSQVDSPPLHALAAAGSGGNGVHAYGPASQFPTIANPNDINYWVDVTFATIAPAVCPCSVWPTAVPAVAAASDGNAVEVGVKFRSDADGYITGIRFYKGPGNTGVHVGNLWSATGTLLETATFGAETSSGWQTVTFAVPIHIAAGATYVASYHTNVGHYAYTYNGLTSQVDTPPLHALASAASGGNGVHAYGAASQFPTIANVNDINYWVDVTFMTTAAAVCPCSVWPAGVPAVAAASDSSAVEVGVKFRSDADGFITGVRFFKGPGNTGVHVGNLWSASGTLLETATFGAETSSGWQTVTFAVPVHITAGTTYVASYHTDVGHYAYTYNGLTSQVDSPPLHALAAAASGGNGVHMYGAASQFPTIANPNDINYWVDITFTTTG